VQGLSKEGYQTESPDIWLTNGNPWEIRRQDIQFIVGFGGTTVTKKDGDKTVTVWEPAEKVRARPGAPTDLASISCTEHVLHQWL
jgi:glycogen phosphorylase